MSQQKRDAHPMLDQCWTRVVDDGPILIQHWVNVLYLLGRDVEKWATISKSPLYFYTFTILDKIKSVKIYLDQKYCGIMYYLLADNQ